MNIQKKNGILLLALAFIAGGIGMIAHQTKAEQKTTLNQAVVSGDIKTSLDLDNIQDPGGMEVPDTAGAEGDEVDTLEAGDTSDEPIVGRASISLSKAKEIATAAYSGTGNLVDTELEMEHGTLVYSTEFRESDGNEVDVKVDATTGSVVTISSDKTEGANDE